MHQAADRVLKRKEKTMKFERSEIGALFSRKVRRIVGTQQK